LLGRGSDTRLSGVEAAAGGCETAATCLVPAAADVHVLLWLFRDTLPLPGSAEAPVPYYSAAPVRRRWPSSSDRRVRADTLGLVPDVTTSSDRGVCDAFSSSSSRIVVQDDGRAAGSLSVTAAVPSRPSTPVCSVSTSHNSHFRADSSDSCPSFLGGHCFSLDSSSDGFHQCHHGGSHIFSSAYLFYSSFDDSRHA